MPKQTWNAIISPDYNNDGTALASSTSLTDISPTPSLVMPANYAYEVARYRVTAAGIFTNTSTPTLLIGIYYGAVAGTVLSATAATTTTTGASTNTWRAEWLMDVRTDGSSGSAVTSGQVYGICGTSFQGVAVSTLTTATIDTTAAKALTLGAQWGTSNASNTITCKQFTVESMN